MVRIFRLLSRPSTGKGERIITYSDQTQQEKPAKELSEQFEQLREILRNFNQNLLQIQTWETPTSTVIQGPWKMQSLPPPGMQGTPANKPETSAGKGMPGMLP